MLRKEKQSFVYSSLTNFIDSHTVWYERCKLREWCGEVGYGCHSCFWLVSKLFRLSPGKTQEERREFCNESLASYIPDFSS